MLQVMLYLLCMLVVHYVVSLARRLSHDTIKVYLCSVQYFSRMFGFPQSITSMVRLLRSIRRTQGPQYTQAQRNPIITNHLRPIHHWIKFLNYSNFQRIALRYLITFSSLLWIHLSSTASLWSCSRADGL